MPAIIDATPSDFTIDRSADVVTASVSVAVLFAPSGSATGEEMIDAVLTSDTSAELDGTASVSW